MSVVLSELNDYHFLTSSAGQRWLDKLAGETHPSPGTIVALRKDLAASRVGLLLEQVELRQRAKAKFDTAGLMLFTRRALEQATDAWVARHKAERFPRCHRIADLCCGIGGDLLALAARGEATGVDRDPVICLLAQYNAEVAGRERCITTQCQAVEQLDKLPAWWHLDPDRRRSERRFSQPEFAQPGWEFIERLVSQSKGGALKLAPAAELSGEFATGVEREWISRGGQCRQQVVWCGELVAETGVRRATVLERVGRVASTISATDDQYDAHRALPSATELGPYLFDPDAAVLASGLTPVLAARYELSPTDGDASYLTGDRIPPEAALTPFRVLASFPPDGKQVRRALQDRSLTVCEFKKRGVPVALTQWEARLGKRLPVRQQKPQKACTLIFHRLSNQTRATLCQRVTTV